MTVRHLITTADPAHQAPQGALQLDVDAMLHEFATDPSPAPAQHRVPTSPRRRRLDFALAAAVAIAILVTAFVPFSHLHSSPADRRPSTPTSTSSAPESEARAAAHGLLDEIRLPASARRVIAPPAPYLAEQRTGLACKGTVSAAPRFWIVPNATLNTVAQYLQTHRPDSAARLNFNHDTSNDISSALTLYNPSSRSEVVIAIATTADGVGIRADADAAPGTACLDPRS